MTKETWGDLESLSYKDYLHIKRTCSKLNKKSELIKDLEKFCDEKIKLYEESELMDFLGQRIDGIASNPLDLIFRIKDWSCEMLEQVKAVYNCSYLETNEEEYKIIRDYIEIILLYKKRVNQTILEIINDIPEELKDNFMNLIPEIDITDKVKTK